MRHSPREREVHEAEHGACEQADGVRLVEEVDGDVLHLLLVDHAEMHPVVHIIFTQGPGAERGRHSFFLSVLASPLIYRDVSGSLSLSGICDTNATRMTAMHVCNLAPNACTTQSAARGKRCMHARNVKMAHALGENRHFLHFHWFACSARRATGMASRKGQNGQRRSSFSRAEGHSVVLSVIYTRSDRRGIALSSVTQ